VAKLINFQIPRNRSGSQLSFGNRFIYFFAFSALAGLANAQWRGDCFDAGKFVYKTTEARAAGIPMELQQQWLREFGKNSRMSHAEAEEWVSQREILIAYSYVGKPDPSMAMQIIVESCLSNQKAKVR